MNVNLNVSFLSHDGKSLYRCIMKVYAYDNFDALTQSPYLESYKILLEENFNIKDIDLEVYSTYLNGQIIFMVEENSEIVAMCFVSNLDLSWSDILSIRVSNPNTKLITAVYTKETRRKLGYARKLIKSIVKIYPNLILDTYVHWVPAMQLYLSCGFKPVDNRKNDKGHVIIFVKGDVVVSSNPI